MSMLSSCQERSLITKLTNHTTTLSTPSHCWHSPQLESEFPMQLPKGAFGEFMDDLVNGLAVNEGGFRVHHPYPHSSLWGARPEVHQPEPPHDSQALEETRAKTSKKKDEFKDWNRPVVQETSGARPWGREFSLLLSSSVRWDTHQQNRFETSVEDFHSVLDQMELNLRYAHGKSTAMSCQNQTLPSLTHQRGARSKLFFTPGPHN